MTHPDLLSWLKLEERLLLDLVLRLAFFKMVKWHMPVVAVMAVLTMVVVVRHLIILAALVVVEDVPRHIETQGVVMVDVQLMGMLPLWLDSRVPQRLLLVRVGVTAKVIRE